jgi:recombination protein RecA
VKESPRSKKDGKVTAILDQINKTYGEGSAIMMGSGPIIGVDTISTGSLVLDQALGIGGLPRGRVVEIYGHEGSGKTTLALHVAAEAAKKEDGICIYVDAEHALDVAYGAKIGVDVDKFIISQPKNGEEALNIVEAFVKSGVPAVIIVDSVAALVPRAELEGEMGDATMGAQARLMSQALRKLVSLVSEANILVVFINQVRSKIGVVYGNPETTTGGNALKFFASVRLEVRKGSFIKGEKGENIGFEANVSVKKNKFSPPFKSAAVPIIYGQGIDRNSEIVDAATNFGILVKSGSWFSYNGKNIAQGKEAVIKILDSDKKMKEEVLRRIREKMLAPIVKDDSKVQEDEKEKE